MYIARLTIGYPREWLASLADYIYYISREISIEHPSVGLALLAQLFFCFFFFSLVVLRHCEVF